MNVGYWVLIGLLAFIAIVFTLIYLKADGFFDRDKKKTIGDEFIKKTKK
jgi:hypothetical protein